MNPEIKKLWIDALRGGEYAQGNSFLKTDEGYCCLGVLCDIHQKSHPIETWVKREEDKGYVYSGGICFLPQVVVKWSEFPTEGEYRCVDMTLSYMNDHTHNFEQIADFIEENL